MSSSSLKSLVIKDILNKIQHGEFDTNETFTESQICTELGISRTPVREALIELLANGIIVKTPRKGYKINEYSNQHKLYAYSVWGALDALAAKEAMPYVTDLDIKQMLIAVEQADVAIKYEDYSAYCIAQDQFHSIYTKKCPNLILLNFLDIIKSSVTRYTYYSEEPKELFALCKESNEGHREIVRLFKAGDKKMLQDFIADIHWAVAHPDKI